MSNELTNKHASVWYQEQRSPTNTVHEQSTGDSHRKIEQLYIQGVFVSAHMRRLNKALTCRIALIKVLIPASLTPTD